MLIALDGEIAEGEMQCTTTSWKLVSLSSSLESSEN